MSVEDGFEARKYLKSLECFEFNKSELDKGLSHNFMFNAANEFIALNNRIDELYDIAIRDLARIKELEHEVKALSEITETDFKCFVEAFHSKGEA